MWVTFIKDVGRKILPAGARSSLHSIERFVDYRVKTRRESATDYVAAFDHRKLARARRSILWHDDWEQATEATLQILREVDLLADGQRVVDFGCGIGRISKALLENYPRDTILAVDRSREMLTCSNQLRPQACAERLVTTSLSPSPSMS